MRKNSVLLETGLLAASGDYFIFEEDSKIETQPVKLSEIDPYSNERFFRELFKDSFTERPKRKSDGVLNSCTYKKDQLGYTHVAFLNNELFKKGVKKPEILKTIRTFRTFFNWMEEPKEKWFTPNTASTSKAYKTVTHKIDDNGNKIAISAKGGRNQKYARWINAVFLDIDSQELSIDELLNFVKKCMLPNPTTIVKTNKGYHIYWFLKERVPATPQVKKLYRHVVTNIMEALCPVVNKVDKKLKDVLRYMSVPKKIMYANYDDKPTLFELQSWLNEYGKLNYKTMKKNNFSNFEKTHSRSNIHTTKGYRDNIKSLEQGVSQGFRNEACFLLACHYKFMRYTKEHVTEKLIKWNESNVKVDADHTSTEVTNTVNSVFESDIYALPHKRLGSLMSEMTGEDHSSCICFYKHKKAREERTKIKGIRNRGYIHNREWAWDIVRYLIKHKRHLVGSQVELAAVFDMPVSTFKDIIKKMRDGKYKALSVVSTKGRGATTTMYLNEVLFKKEPLPYLFLSNENKEFIYDDICILEDSNNAKTTLFQWLRACSDGS